MLQLNWNYQTGNWIIYTIKRKENFRHLFLKSIKRNKHNYLPQCGTYIKKSENYIDVRGYIKK
jgi:hypothetical protein